MDMKDVSVPEIYKESQDFRFFLDWFQKALTVHQYDTQNLVDLYDPQRCKEDLLWLLGDTIGYKFDDRLCSAYNRLVMMYFMSMIRKKGSEDGVTLAAEVNLAQYNIQDYGKEKDILQNRLEDTSIPVNAVYVSHDVDQGYIDIVYFTSRGVPIDACIEYVRPLGMYCFQHEGVRFDSRTKVCIDARLTNTNESKTPQMITRVGHYSRADYASLQSAKDEESRKVNLEHTRRYVWYRNSDAEIDKNEDIDPGYRALDSIQLSNNEHIVKSLMPQIFELGFEPQTVDTVVPDDYIISREDPAWNLRLDRIREESITKDVYTVESDRTKDNIHPRPAVAPVMRRSGDAIVYDDKNEFLTKDENGVVTSHTDADNC